jgi:hypothetical protein
MNHEVNTKTLYAIIAFAISIFTVCPFLGGAAKALSPTLVINVLYHDVSFVNSRVSPLALHTQPLVVHIGNVFKIHAIILNNSPATISFISGPCDSPLSSTFDKNVVVKHGVRCFLGAAVHLVKLRPGETGQVIGPGIGTTYQAAAPGMTVTTVTFHYQSDNGASASVTRSFEFNIV